MPKKTRILAREKCDDAKNNLNWFIDKMHWLAETYNDDYPLIAVAAAQAIATAQILQDTCDNIKDSI